MTLTTYSDRETAETMKAAIGGAATLFLTVGILPAILHAAYFYTTDNVTAVDIGCGEDQFRTTSRISCASKCREMNCYKFRYENGVCKITDSKLSQQTPTKEGFYRKVCSHE